MNWTDEGIVLTARKHGESSSIVTLLTKEHGVHGGLVRGGSGKRGRGIYEAGNFVVADWRARLEDHLGSYKCELMAANAALVLDDPMRLAGLSSACAVTVSALPEREPHQNFYATLKALVETIEAENWLGHYVAWELNLLTELGFGLDLSECASTGSRDDLIYVSPKSGRAVSSSAGEPYRDKLLQLPQFLQPPERTEERTGEQTGEQPGELPGNLGDSAKNTEITDIAAGLNLTGYFLDRHAFIHHKNGAPPARTRLVDRVTQMATISSS